MLYFHASTHRCELLRKIAECLLCLSIRKTVIQGRFLCGLNVFELRPASARTDTSFLLRLRVSDFETSGKVPVQMFVLVICSCIVAAGVAAVVAAVPLLEVRSRSRACALAPRRCEAFDSSPRRNMQSGFKGLQLCLRDPITCRV